jgi:hypothetical protein
MRKILNLIVVLIILFSLLTITGNTQGISATAVDLHMNEDVTFYLGDRQNPNDYKIVISERGELTITIDTNARHTDVIIYNLNGIEVKPIRKDATAGSWIMWGGKDVLLWNETVQIARGTIVYDLIERNTYYLRLNSDNGTESTGKPITINVSFMTRSEMERNAPLTANDALTVLRASAGLIELTAEQKERYGISGTATAADALRILRISAGLE